MYAKLASAALVAAASLWIVESAGAQGVPEGNAGLQARITALEANRVDATVVCGSNQSIGAVLEQHAGRSAPLFIRVAGVCVESLTIFRNQVTIFANAPGDGIRAPAGAFNAIQVLGGTVNLVGLAIQAETDAVAVRRGGAVFGRDLTINVGHYGISVQGASIELLNSTIEQTMTSPLPGAAGIQVTAGTAVISGGTIRNFAAATGGQCGICADGSSATLRNTTIEGNNTGISITGTYLSAFETLVRTSAGTGIDARSSTLRMFGGAITGNGAHAVLMIASYGSFSGSTAPFLIEGNTGTGIRARLNSVVSLESAVTIRASGGGMQLSDGSAVTAFPPASPAIQITANQRGIVCLGSPGSGGFGYISDFGSLSLDGSNVFGNGPPGPNISCPGIFVP